MNQKPRPSVKKKAAAKEAARAERLAAKQQAQETRNAAKEAREKAKRESAEAKAEAKRTAEEEATIAAERDAAKIREIEQRWAREAQGDFDAVPNMEPAAPTVLASPGGRKDDIARFTAAATRAHESNTMEYSDSYDSASNQSDSDSYFMFDTQTIPIVEQETLLNNVSQRDASGFQRRSSQTQFDIPRGQTQEFQKVSFGGNGDFDDSPFFSSAEPIVGMKKAKGYKRKAGPLHIIARIIGILISVAMMAAVLGIGTLTVKEYRPKDSSPVEIENPNQETIAKGQQISLLTWDIGYCGLSADTDSALFGGSRVNPIPESEVRENLNDVESVISHQNVDIVLLQEVDKESSRSHKIDEAKDLTNSMASSGYSSAFATDQDVLFVPYPIPPIGSINSGIMTQNRFFAKDAERISAYDPLKWPQSLVGAKPCILVERLPITDSTKQLVLMNVHLSDYDNENDRAQQAGQLELLIKREYDKGNYVIVGGNFSQTFSNVDNPFGQAKSGLWQPGTMDEGIFSEESQLLMDPKTPSARSLDKPYNSSDDSFQFYMVDGFIASKNIQVDSIETIDQGFKNSNHNPVKLVATLK